MIQILFRRFDKSEIVKETIHERIEPILEKFPELQKERIAFTLSMLNSRTQAGPDLFRVKVQIKSGQYKDIVLECSNMSFYGALAEVIDKIHERLKRHDEKIRNNNRQDRRKRKVEMIYKSESEHLSLAT